VVLVTPAAVVVVVSATPVPAGAVVVVTVGVVVVGIAVVVVVSTTDVVGSVKAGGFTRATDFGAFVRWAVARGDFVRLDGAFAVACFAADWPARFFVDEPAAVALDAGIVARTIEIISAPASVGRVRKRGREECVCMSCPVLQ
jgi:hypothetical protein